MANNNQLSPLAAGIINADRGVGNLLIGGSNALGLSGLSNFLKNRGEKRTAKQTRWLNNTGTDDPMILDMLKDYYRPARQGAVGLGMLASKLGGGDVSRYLDPGTQGIGDWSFLLDEEERKALQERPGVEALKSLANVAGQYATGGLTTAYGQAAKSAPTAMGRILGKGSLSLPGNILQGLGMTQEYKGESPVSSVIGSTISSYAFPAAEEALGAIGRLGKGKSMDELRKEAFKSAGVNEQEVNKISDYYSQMAPDKDPLTVDIELLQRGKKMADMKAPEKNAVKNYLLAIRDSGAVDEGQVNMLLKDFGVEKGVVSTQGMPDTKLQDYGINKSNIDKIGGTDRAKQGIAIFEKEAKDQGIKLNDRFARENAIDDVIGSLDSQLQPELDRVPPVSKNEILNSFENSVKDIKGYQNNPAYVEFVNKLNNYGDNLTGGDLRDLFTSIQEAGKLEQLSPSARASTSRIFTAGRDSVRKNVIGNAGTLMSKIGSVLDLKKAITKRSMEGVGPTVFGMQIKTPPLTKLVDRTAGAIGSGLSRAGAGLGSLGSLAGQVPGQLAGQLGGAAGRAFGQGGVMGAQDGEAPQGLGMGEQPEQGQVVDINIPGFSSAGQANDPLGLYSQQQQPQQAVDWQRLNMDLANAVGSGQLSPTEADYILQSMQKNYGGGGQDITSQIGALAQQDPQQASQLLGQAVLGGQIDPTTAKTYAGLMGFDDRGKVSGEELVAATSALEGLNTMKNIIQETGSVPFATALPFEGFSQNAQVYENAANEVKDVITRSRTGAALNLDEQKFYDNYIPRIKDTEASRNDKLKRLTALYSALAVDAQGGSVDEIMMAYQNALSGDNNEQSAYSDYEQNY